MNQLLKTIDVTQGENTEDILENIEARYSHYWSRF